jgi:hypothetical protein
VLQFTGSRTITADHNSLGLRDIEFVPGSGRTLLFLGNSMVWGYDVEAGDRFTERMRQDWPAVTVVNAGIPGYGTDQAYLLLQRLWPRVKPNVVVLIFALADRDVNTASSWFAGLFKPYLAKVDGQWKFQGQPVPKGRQFYFYESWIARHSALARFVIATYSSARHPKVYVPDPTDQLIRMMRDSIETRGGKFLVGLQRHDARMEALLQSERIPYTTLEGAEVIPEQCSCHWTPKGQIFVAQQLEALLAAQGLAPN